MPVSPDASLTMYHEKKDAFWSQKALGAAQQAERLTAIYRRFIISLGNVYTASGKGSEGVSELNVRCNSRQFDDGYRGSARPTWRSDKETWHSRLIRRLSELNHIIGLTTTTPARLIPIWANMTKP